MCRKAIDAAKRQAHAPEDEDALAQAEATDTLHVAGLDVAVPDQLARLQYQLAFRTVQLIGRGRGSILIFVSGIYDIMELV